jgi:hypothetical protein
MKYKVYVTSAYYIAKDGVLEWANEVDKTIGEFESKQVEEHDTVAEALESMNNWGSKWVMYDGVLIENEEGEEVWSSYPALYKCECCNREEWERVEGGLYLMKGKDGKKLFPAIV